MADSNTKLLDFTMLQRYHELLQPLILSIFNENMPDSLPASDVSSWAKQATKPKYTASEVGADAAGSAATALSEAKTYAQTYVDDEINALIGGADSTKDTLKELADAIAENSDLMDTLNSAIGKKANASDLTSHTSNKSNPHGVTLAQLGVTSTAAELNLLDGVTATTAEINYLDGVTSAIQTQLNAKAANKNMTGATASAAGAAGLVPAPASGANGKFLRGDGTWATPTNTTYSAATASALGLVKIGSNITNDSGTISLTKANVTAALGYTPPTTNTTYSNFVKSGSGAAAGLVPAPSTTAGTTKYLREDGTWVTPPNTTYSAATTSANGLMTAAMVTKLNTITDSADAVSFTQALTSGTKVGTININGTDTILYAPTNTDTHYTTKLVTGASATAAANAAASNGSVYLNILDNTTVRNSHLIKGTGATTVTCDADGVITINSTDTNTTYSLSSFGITATAAELNKLDGVTVTATKINYLTDVTSNIQAQLNGKAASSHTHTGYLSTTGGTITGPIKWSSDGLPGQSDELEFILGIDSFSEGGTTKWKAASDITVGKASSLAVSAAVGSATNPVYIDANGKPVKTTYTLGASVPSGAKFTDTTYSAATASALGLVKIGSNITNSSGTISLTKDNVTAALGYTPPTTNTTYSAATTSAAGLMAAADKTKLDATNVAYCTCATAAGTAAKVLTVVGNTNWKLTTGSIIIVNPSYTNTASNPTFNVNGTGAKSISVGGTTLTTSMLAYAGYGGRVAVYVYDGTLFRFVTWAYDANSTYNLSSFGITATAAELNLLDGVTATTAEINYLDGVTSNIQTQLNGKAASGHTHSYLSTGGGVVSGNVQQSGATTDYTTYKFRNIAVGTSTTPTSNSTYGGSGAIYIYCP